MNRDVRPWFTLVLGGGAALLCTFAFCAHPDAFAALTTASSAGGRAGGGLSVWDAGGSASTPHTHLVIMLLSSPTLASHMRRGAQRKTWLTYSTRAKTVRPVHHFFLIGTGGLDAGTLQDLRTEQEEFNDLRFLDGFVDAYTKLTEKLLRGIVLSHEEFGNYAYLLKADGDSFVRLDTLLDILEGLPEHQKQTLYWGQFMFGAIPHQPSGKWDDPDWNLQATYPPYALGGGYIVSGPPLWTIAQHSTMYSIFRNEDATLGLWLSPFNLSRWDDPRIDTLSSPFEPPDPPRCKEDDLIEHRVPIEGFYKRDRNLRTSNFQSMCTAKRIVGK
jgi:hypothetical protein